MNIKHCSFRRNIWFRCLVPEGLLIFVLFIFSSCADSGFNIVNYGAVGDAETINTAAIQKAIDEASENGGGRVIIPAGQFVSGSLFLKSNTELYIEKGARLLGSTNRLDYGNDTAHALISAIDQQNISITGEGIIDGQGAEVVKDLYVKLRDGDLSDDQYTIKRPRESARPELVAFLNCSNISITGVTLKNSARWVLTFRSSSNIVVDRLCINSTVYWNNDGIDVVNSKDVLISNCNIDCADDGICLKSEGSVKGVCENVTVENCTIRSSASGFKIGTGSHGGFKNIKVRGLTVFDTYRSAIAIECVDGASLEDVDVRDVVARHTGNAIFIRLGHRNNNGAIGSLKNVYIGNVSVYVPSGKPDVGYPLEGPRQKYSHNVFPASISGLPGHPVEGVTLENIDIIYEGGGNKETAFFDWKKLEEVTENEAGYPEFSMFGELPVWGFYVRHVSELKMKNIKFSKTDVDYRPAVAFNDVSGLTIDSLEISGCEVLPNLIFKNVSSLQYENIVLSADLKKGIFAWD